MDIWPCQFNLTYGASIIAFLIGLVIVFDPARNVAQFFTQLQSSLILLDSVHSIFDIEAEKLNLGEVYDNSKQPIAIQFENVSFNYSSESETLKIFLLISYRDKRMQSLHWFR